MAADKGQTSKLHRQGEHLINSFKGLMMLTNKVLSYFSVSYSIKSQFTLKFKLKSVPNSCIERAY